MILKCNPNCQVHDCQMCLAFSNEIDNWKKTARGLNTEFIKTEILRFQRVAYDAKKKLELLRAELHARGVTIPEEEKKNAQSSS